MAFATIWGRKGHVGARVLGRGANAELVGDRARTCCGRVPVAFFWGKVEGFQEIPGGVGIHGRLWARIRGRRGVAPALPGALPAWRAVGSVHSVRGGFLVLELVRGGGGGSSQKVSSSSDIGGGCRLPCRKFSGNLRAAGGVREAEAVSQHRPGGRGCQGAGVLVENTGLLRPGPCPPGHTHTHLGQGNRGSPALRALPLLQKQLWA